MLFATAGQAVVFHREMDEHDDIALLLPVNVAARALGLPIKWFRQQLDDGRLPVIKAGSRRLVDVDQIRRALRDRAECEREKLKSEATSG